MSLEEVQREERQAVGDGLDQGQVSENSEEKDFGEKTMVIKSCILVAIISLVIVPVVRGAQDAHQTIDASYVGSFTKSLEAAKQSLPANQKKKFEEAYIIFMSHILVRKKESLGTFRKGLHGKTGSEVIEAASKIVQGLRMQRQIEEFHIPQGLELESLAEQGNPLAQLKLGLLYEAGISVPQNYREAQRWYHSAADQGLYFAQYKLGLSYAQQENYIHAHMWINLAAAAQGNQIRADIDQENQIRATLIQGHRIAARKRKEVAALMSPMDIAKAHRLALEWKSQQTPREKNSDSILFSRLLSKPFYSIRVESTKKLLKLLLDEQISQSSTTTTLPRTTPLKTLPATNLEESLKRSLPDMPTPAPVRRVPKLSRERSKIQPDQKSFTPKILAPPLLKIPESPEQIPAMPPPPKMMDTVKKLMESLKSTTRTPTPKPVPLPRTKPSPKASPSIKPPPSEIGQRIAKLSIPEVAPVESIKQRLDQMHVQSLSDTNTSVSQPSPGQNRYIAIIKAAINKHWKNPDVPINNKKVIITFHVEKSGEISRVHVEQSSGNSYYDSAILGAIHKAKLPKFPSDLQKSFLTIKFLFTMPE